MKKILTLLASVMLACSAHAIQWTGTITGTVQEGIQSDDGFVILYEYFDPGETWTWSYSYESDTVDGEFTIGHGQASDNNLIVENAENVVMIGGVQLDGFASFLVEDSIIQRFSLASFAFTIQGGWWDFDGFGGGPVTITDPVSASSIEAVPDSSPGLLLSAFVFAGLLVIRRFK